MVLNSKPTIGDGREDRMGIEGEETMRQQWTEVDSLMESVTLERVMHETPKLKALQTRVHKIKKN